MIPGGALDVAARHMSYSDLLRANMDHQRQFLADILTDVELITWRGVFSAQTPGTTFEAFASATPRGDEAILLSAPVFYTCTNYADFMIWRLSQHGKRFHELSDEQLEDYSALVKHVLGAMLGSGTFCSDKEYRRVRPNSEGAYLARAAASTSMVFFVVAHEFAHIQLQHRSDIHSRPDGMAEVEADSYAVRLLGRHIYFNGPKMGLNRSVVAPMLLAPFCVLVICRILIQSRTQQSTVDLLGKRFDALRERFHDLLLQSLGADLFDSMEASLQDNFFRHIPDIGLGLLNEEPIFIEVLNKILDVRRRDDQV